MLPGPRCLFRAGRRGQSLRRARRGHRSLVGGGGQACYEGHCGPQQEVVAGAGAAWEVSPARLSKGPTGALGRAAARHTCREPACPPGTTPCAPEQGPDASRPCRGPFLPGEPRPCARSPAVPACTSAGRGRASQPCGWEGCWGSEACARWLFQPRPPPGPAGTLPGCLKARGSGRGLGGPAQSAWRAEVGLEGSGPRRLLWFGIR